MKQAAMYRRRFAFALLVLLFALLVCAATTHAWYILTVQAHTTRLHLAAGAGVQLQISKTADTGFASAVALEEFHGALYPVSTDRIQNGFQQADGFLPKNNLILANLFKRCEESEQYYMHTTLYFRTNASQMAVYLADLSFTDNNEEYPISAAVRVGFVVRNSGEEYIFAISDKENPQRVYNTEQGMSGHVLDSTRTDGATVPFTPYDARNFCIYHEATGQTQLQAQSVPLCMLTGGEQGFGEPTEVEIYVWLEGCDEDCIGNIGKSALEDLALQFAGVIPTHTEGGAHAGT